MTPPGFHQQPGPGSDWPRRLGVLGLMTILAAGLPLQVAQAGPDLSGERIIGFDVAGVTLRMADRDIEARLSNGSGWVRQSVDRQPCQQPKPATPAPAAAAGAKPPNGATGTTTATAAAPAAAAPPTPSNEPLTCARTMSFLRENGGTMEGLVVDLIEDVDQPVGTTSAWRIRYRAGGMTEFSPGSFLQHATEKYGPFTLANVEGSFFWGIAVPMPAGPAVTVDRSKPYLAVSPIRFQVMVEDESFQRQRVDALAARLRDVRDQDNRTQASQRPGRPGF